MNVQVEGAIKRARAYWFIDGFTEMAAGGFFVLLAALLLLGGRASPATFSSWFLSMAGEITVAKSIGILVILLLLWWLKDHFTYPRTGFVRGKRITWAQVMILLRNIVLFLLLPVIGLTVVSLLLAPAGKVLSSMPVWFPIAVSLLWACLLALAGAWLGLSRFRILAGLIFLAGIAIGIWQFTIGLTVFPSNIEPDVMRPSVIEDINRTLASLSFLVLISGVILIFSGLLTFLQYRKENPAPYAEDA